MEARTGDADWRATLTSLGVAGEQPRAARVVVDKSEKVLMAYDAEDHLIAQFPATMGSTHDPLPLGRWEIRATAHNPPFHYNPALFWDASPGDRRLTLPPGPNGPVGVVWIDLSQGALRHSRHARAADDRPDPEPWLHPPDQLGCGPARADGAAGRGRRCSRNERRVPPMS